MKILSIGDIKILDKSLIVEGVTILQRGIKVQIKDLWPDRTIIIEEIDQKLCTPLIDGHLWPITEDYIII